MKQRIIRLIAMLCLLAVGACASAASMTDGLYTDVTSVMTQDAVLDLEVYTDEPIEECSIVLQQPDMRSMTLLEKIYDFVWRQGNRPVRYYDVETQEKIQALVPEIDIDILHLTEFMGQEMYGQPTGEVVMERLLDVEYYPGQLVVVVLGYQMENGEYRWFPYRAEVPRMGLIRYTVPKADYDELVGQSQVIYHVLTDRIGARGEVLTEKEIIRDQVGTPSKGYQDIIRIRRWRTASGETIDDPFRIFLVDRTKEMNREIERIGKFLAEDGERQILQWFPEEIADHARLLLGEEAKDNVLAYDIVAVMSENYKDTYGDVATENVFASAYSPDHEMVVMLGFELPEEELAKIPEEELDKVTHFEWYALRAEAMEDFVEIVFKQLVIPTMETEPAMMIVISEPLEQ